MSRIRVLAYAAVAICSITFVPGCKDQPTGVRITVRLHGVGYDELRFGVLDLGGDGNNPKPLVDPEGAGRKTNLKGATNPDVVVLLDDSLDGHDILCDVAALTEGMPTGNGDGHVQARAHQVRDVDVVLTAAPGYDAGAPGDANTSGSGGSAAGVGGETGGGGSGAGGSGAGGASGSGGAIGTGGVSGAGGANGSGGTSGSGGSNGTGGTGMGGAGGIGGATGTGGQTGTGMLGTPCNSGAQCASTFCADSVCCESACTGACTTCNLNNGQAGHCLAAMNKVIDPHRVCIDAGPNGCTDGTCTNSGTCTQKTFGTACAAACASTTERSASGICSQAGTCLAIGSIPCTAPMPSCVAPNMCQ